MIVWWLIFFYGSLALNYTLNPFMQGYHESGNFTVLGKSLDSLKINLIWYALYGVLFLIICGILYFTAWGKNATKLSGGLLAALVGLNLAFSLLQLALVIGYGLVKIPIACWKSSNLEKRLDFFRYRAAYYDDKIIEVTAEKKNNLQQLIFCSREIQVEPEHADYKA